MLNVASAMGWACTLIAAAGCIYAAMTAFFVLRFLGSRPNARSCESPVSSPPRSVTILKPLHGAELGLRQNLDAHFSQDLAFPVEIVFGVQRADDPAIDVAQAVIAAHPGTPALVAVGDRPGAPNRKIANLIQMTAHAAGDVLVITDSDIRPPPDHLRRVLEALSAPGVGVVTCPYVGEGAAGFWSDIAALGLSYQFLPNVITGVSLGLAKPCMGSTLALRRETLAKIGGFEAFAHVLADDYALGAAVRGLGLRSAMAPFVVTHVCTEKTLGEVFRHELRWARTIRGVDPAGHAGSLVTHPVPIALAGAILTGLQPAPLAMFALAVVARFLLSAAIDRASRRRARLRWGLPLRDMLSFVVFVTSFLGRAVEWQGEKFHVTSEGDLSPV